MKPFWEISDEEAAEFMQAQIERLESSGMLSPEDEAELRKMKEMIEGGELGRLVRTTWIVTDWYRTQIYYDSGGWRATWAGEGGGVLLNQCPHNLDLYQWLVGMPSRVTGFASIGKYHDIEGEDDVTAIGDAWFAAIG